LANENNKHGSAYVFPALRPRIEALNKSAVAGKNALSAGFGKGAQTKMWQVTGVFAPTT